MLDSTVSVTSSAARDAVRSGACARPGHKYRAVWGLSDGGVVRFVRPCAAARERQGVATENEFPAAAFVVLESEKWIFADPGGELGKAAPLRGASSPSVALGGECACGASSVEQEVLRMRQIPWQTPHCVDKDGKLLLSETGQE